MFAFIICLGNNKKTAKAAVAVRILDSVNSGQIVISQQSTDVAAPVGFLHCLSHTLNVVILG